MYQEPIFLKPVFQERIWGGDKLQTLFGYAIPNELTGEAWVISAHKNGPSMILNGPLQGQNLAQAWQEHPSLFGKEMTDGDFPLLVKILDANDNLSVQVHPNDAYARKVENEPYGKTECWYVLDCEPDSEIIFGHRADTQEDFKSRVDAGEWTDLLKSVPVKKGDFFYVPSGTIHAIGKGIVILEIQQSSDITYRVYDYDRKDAEGHVRGLHIQPAIEVTNYPHISQAPEKIEESMDDLVITRLVKEQYFTVYDWKLKGKVVTPLQADYLLVSIVNGTGEITIDGRSFPLKKGDNFILPAMIKSYELEGDLEIVVAHE
ncbi:mannose-6-phosphate isomerase, class I [Sporosarcina beigongshangi]|uniref:mannose-6-phosphate isomerase, class I n=1 Tax=Sporosarcina beigongshangi TaxID=2782538 RepID=UPI001939527B|nr:mannose-6-phosphate isomerase, class I [Sporosarcina beigongshangi]